MNKRIFKNNKRKPLPSDCSFGGGFVLRVFLFGAGLRPPMRLHYSQTPGAEINPIGEFETPMKLHYSQTLMSYKTRKAPFETPMKLHYSQTPADNATSCV